jgi:glycosyltransferase involved in cell wall biosynthesis
VSTDCPSGPSEILLDGELGVLVRVGDAEAMAAAIEQALAAPVDRDRLTSRAEEFSLNQIAKQYELLFEEMWQSANEKDA